MEGFFQESTLVDTRKASLNEEALASPKCGKCLLYKACKRPYRRVYGGGGKGILMILSAPTVSADKTGDPFSGSSGELLKSLMDELELKLKDVWITYAVACHPYAKGWQALNTVRYCRPNVLKTIQELKPTSIVLMGSLAIESVISWTWKESCLKGGAPRWNGWTIPDQMLNTWICPTWSLEELVVATNPKEKYGQQILSRFLAHLSQAVSLAEKRPWKKVPDWESTIQTFPNADDAVPFIRQIIEMGKPTAFDYEGTGLKPEYEGYEILTASMSIGTKLTVAFPMWGRAKKEFIKFLKSDVPKIAAVMKHEDRVSRRALGVNVRNWYFDVALGAHYLDCQPNITSLKFQVYVRLGFGSYNDHIEPFLQGSPGQVTNRAKEEIALQDMLVYNGLDSLLEVLLAQVQIRDITAYEVHSD